MANNTKYLRLLVAVKSVKLLPFVTGYGHCSWPSPDAPPRLSNRYFLVRAGESEYDSRTFVRRDLTRLLRSLMLLMDYIVPDYSFLDARGLGAYEGKELEAISEVPSLPLHKSPSRVSRNTW
ncbi:hypothetical protein V6N13_070258 [Hibiscus sabdariffa]|uniref:Uncharacterized protein n=1 Tax=Hibiscus sabdariffa TaxID=183260 RepID=A0ABR2TGX4_9ROSI